LYSFLTLFIVLIVAIVVAANSSWVIKKAADKFAPEYKISYDDITGNVFTGVNIAGLKFDNKAITKNIKFSWNPSKILYKRVAINEISGEDLDVETVKALIASFPKSVDDENSSSSPLPVVINVDKIHLTIKPFEEQGILIEKTVLDVEDVSYAFDDISVETLSLTVDTNITNLTLLASLDDGKLIINELSVENIDSEVLEKMFLPQEDNASVQKEQIEEKEKEVAIKQDSEEKSEEMNALIPKEILLRKFFATVKPRSYKTVAIDKLEISVLSAEADLAKILSNTKNAISVGQYKLNFQSDVGQINLDGDLQKSIVTLESINVSKVDTLALKAMFAPDNNESNVTKTETLASVDEKRDENSTETKKENNLIPKRVVIKEIHTDILPAIYDPVHILEVVLDVKDIKFDVEKRLVEEAVIVFNGKTNLTNFKNESKIKNNELLGHIVLTPNHKLFEMYKLPLRKEAIGDIRIDFDASEERVTAQLSSKAKNFFIASSDSNSSMDSNTSDSNKSKEFTVDIDELTSKVVYIVKQNSLEANTKIMITTPYAKDISVTNKFVMNKSISYSGAINADKIIGLDAKLVEPLHNFTVTYEGDLASVKTDISSDGLKGSFVSSDMKKGHFHLETTQAIEVDKMIVLPGELNGTKVNVNIDAPLNFEKIASVKAKAKIRSNISNIDADINYGKTLQVKITSTIPKDSLLKNFDKNVKWSAISPLVINADLGEKTAILKLKSKALSTDINYGLEKGAVDGKIQLAGLVMKVKGESKEKISIKANVNSMESLMNSVQSLYTMEALPPVEGAINLALDITKLQEADLTLSSPAIIYHADRETEHLVEDIKLVLSANKSQVQLKSYNVSYDEMKIFSSKPSVINMKENVIEIAPLWLNDQLQVVGTYDLKTKKGNISADANPLHIAHKMIELDTDINIKTVLNAEKTSIKGNVILQGGTIKYDLGTKSYPSDSDIIVVQDMKKEEASPFMDNLSMLVHVTTKKPLIYKQGPIDIQAQVNLDIHKGEHSDPLVLGEANILKGGSYTFEGKKFVLDRSNIYFTGDPSKPMLDISVKYKSLNHLITIAISGTPATPNIIFSSIPSLKKEQILSIILFDSEAGAGTNSGEDMMKMMGGAMAKSALSDMGIKLDHLALGTDGSVEVGKKLTDKIMFIYINDVIPQMKVKYLHNSRLESVITADEESEAYDIVYKRDFSADDITILGR